MINAEFYTEIGILCKSISNFIMNFKDELDDSLLDELNKIRRFLFLEYMYALSERSYDDTEEMATKETDN